MGGAIRRGGEGRVGGRGGEVGVGAVGGVEGVGGRGRKWVGTTTQNLRGGESGAVRTPRRTVTNDPSYTDH